MFDIKSDYAVNKYEKDAIVCRSVTGVSVFLTRDDFHSEEEFLRWKVWSDSDYHATERKGRSFYDNCFPLNERLGHLGAVPSAEDIFLNGQTSVARVHARRSLLQKVRGALSKKQYRRLRLYYVEGLIMRDIAVKEKISQQGISNSIRDGVRALQKAKKC